MSNGLSSLSSFRVVTFCIDSTVGIFISREPVIVGCFVDSVTRLLVHEFDDGISWSIHDTYCVVSRTDLFDSHEEQDERINQEEIRITQALSIKKRLEIISI